MLRFTSILIIVDSTFVGLKVTKFINEFSAPSESSCSQFAPGECGDIKLFTISDLNEQEKAEHVGFMFLTPWLRIQQKNFSKGS